MRAGCFDAFGTLVEIVDKRRPFQTLLRGNAEGDLAKAALTRRLDLQSVAKLLTIELDSDQVARLERDLEAEIASIRLRSGIAELWSELPGEEVKIGVCSNLALPYGQPLTAALPGIPDIMILSYEAGLAKPDPAIFHLVCRELDLEPDEILFVGDTQSADIDGPRAIGMPAMLISDFMSS